jgi:hypothetical protein
MVIPTIHLNGTDAETILRNIRIVMDPLETAIEHLESTGPHGRDYYVQGPDVIATAIHEHCDRVARLRSVYNEISEIYWAVVRREQR